METENFDGKLIYEHENEDGLITRVYLKNTADNYATNSKNFTLMFYAINSDGVIAINEMYNSWVYGGAVPTYPNLAYYTNTPTAIKASSIAYSDSNTAYKKEAGLYCTTYQANFSYLYHDTISILSCNVIFRSDGSFSTNGEVIKN